MRVFKICLKSLLTGLGTLFAAVALAGTVLIARVLMSSGISGFTVGLIAGPVLLAAFLIFGAGFLWQYLRLSHKGGRP